MQNWINITRHVFRRSPYIFGHLQRLSFVTGKPAVFKKFKQPAIYTFSIMTLFGFSDEKKEDEVVTAIKRSIILIERQEYNKAEQMLHVALRMAQSREDQQAITYIYDAMANLALERDQFDKAKKLFVDVTQRLLRDGVSDDDLRVLHINLKLARISHMKGELENAQTGFDWCLNKLRKKQGIEDNENINRLIALGEEWYGKLLIDGHRSQQGLKYLMDSYDKISKMADKDINYMVMTLNDMATVCSQNNLSEKAAEYLKQAIEMAKGQEVPLLGALHVNLGMVYLNMNMIDQARKSCGYGYRLGADSRNEDIKKEAKKCIEKINKYKNDKTN